MKQVSAKNANVTLTIALSFSILYVLVTGGVALWQLRLVAAGTKTAYAATWVVGIAAGACFLLAVVAAWLASRMVRSLMHWYDNMLDSIPFPVSVTDTSGNWTFLNAPVEQMLNVKRADMLGKPCKQWGAAICGTSNCGMECLKRGEGRTRFEQGGGIFQVDVSYLEDEAGKKSGHIEVVQDISQMVGVQQEQTRLVGEISRMCESFMSASDNISGGAQALAQASVQQAASVEELSSMIADVARQTEMNTNRAEEAARLAESIRGTAERGSGQMRNLNEAVREISEASESIGRVIKVIDDIAFQTNILALNAAVEAARAGQHGKGFAVVADEVRNLAGKSAEAAKNTSQLIAGSVEKAAQGVRIADETAASLGEIVDGIVQNSQLVNKISESSVAQNTAISQINAGIDQVSSVVQQNTATAQQSAAASEEMNSQTNALRTLLANFGQQTGNGTPRALPPAYKTR